MATTTYTPSMLRGAGTRGIPEIPAGSSFSNPYSLNFDGIDDVVTLDTKFSFASEYSLSIWVNPTVLNNNQVILGNGSSSQNWIRLSSASVITWKIGSSTATISDVGNNLVVDNWQHLLFFRNSSNNIGVFRNGAAFGSITITGQTQELITIGKRGNIEYSGLIDEVAFFSSDQSSNISTIYNGGVPGDLTSLSPSGWWRFNEGSGTTATDSAGSNNGTISGVTYSTNVPT